MSLVSIYSLCILAISCFIYYVTGYGFYTYSPSFEALSGIKGIKLPGPGEDNLFLIPERNFFMVGDVKIYSCKICRYTTRDPKDYESHALTKHFYPGHEKDDQWIHDFVKNQDYNYTCKVCGEAYKSMPMLLWHLTKTDHINQSLDDDLLKYLWRRVVLNDTVNRKVVYHPMQRPFWKEEQPKNWTFAPSAELKKLFDGFNRATYDPNMSDLSSGDNSEQLLDSEIIRTGWSKYNQDDFEKHVKKIKGVNRYIRTTTSDTASITDESRERERLKWKEYSHQESKEFRQKLENISESELMKKEAEESFHSAGYYRRQLDEYGPDASHDMRIGEKERKKITKKIRVSKSFVKLRELDMT